tara:strand:+ start:32 stop:550 length:519 start_codon:yes stop_codon:yes gene_type:complete
MSRTKRRIKKLLKRALPLAALAGGAMLLGRGKGTAFARPKAGTIDQMAADNMPKGIDKVIEDVVVPKNITSPNINLGRMTGSGPTKGEIGQDIRANYARKMRNIAADRNRNNMLRAIRSNVDMATTPDSILQGVPEEALMAKDGGKIVKGEKKAVRKKINRIQIKGFGKARK